MLTVEKIGGTSMSQFQDVLANIIKGKRSGSELYNRIFVVSINSHISVIFKTCFWFFNVFSLNFVMKMCWNNNNNIFNSSSEYGGFGAVK